MSSLETYVRSSFGRVSREYTEHNDELSGKNELEMAAYNGQKWKIAVEVFGGFFTSLKLDIVNTLSRKGYENDDELRDCLSILRMTEVFSDLAGMYIERGEEAEQELRDNNG